MHGKLRAVEGICRADMEYGILLLLNPSWLAGWESTVSKSRQVQTNVL